MHERIELLLSGSQSRELPETARAHVPISMHPQPSRWPRGRLSPPNAPEAPCLSPRSGVRKDVCMSRVCIRARTCAPFKSPCLQIGPIRHALTMVHTLLAEPGPDFKPYFISKFESDLNTTFSKSHRKEILHFPLKASIATAVQELNYKVTSRRYSVPSLLHRW